jgi:hypothetical protein
MGFGGLVARFKELKEDERFKGTVHEAMEWMGLFLIMIV